MIAEKPKKVIPRQLFEVPIQAAIGTKIIARETVRQCERMFLVKCYGEIFQGKGNFRKQKAGKQEMRQIGSVELPSEYLCLHLN